MNTMFFYGILGIVPFDFMIGVCVIVSAVTILGCSVMMLIDAAEDGFDIVAVDWVFGTMVMVSFVAVLDDFYVMSSDVIVVGGNVAGTVLVDFTSGVIGIVPVDVVVGVLGIVPVDTMVGAYVKVSVDNIVGFVGNRRLVGSCCCSATVSTTAQMIIDASTVV
jgi:hypothetical protein